MENGGLKNHLTTWEIGSYYGSHSRGHHTVISDLGRKGRNRHYSPNEADM